MSSRLPPSHGKRILVIQLERLGDLVEITPLVVDLFTDCFRRGSVHACTQWYVRRQSI